MPITIIDHAQERMLERGASEDEVRITLEEGIPSEAKSGRKAKEKILIYDGFWQGQRYPQKKVRVIYVEEGDEMVVLTVYVYHGQWEE